MSKIHIMPGVLASQVAAGEVVERPASVIKELVENSLDAGAKTISVEIRRGGFSLMKVTDDGSGMSPDDARLSFERHATSKLLTVEDLFEISHLGFRGEALPSIASVSRVKLSTREASSIEGFELNVEGGAVHEPRACGMSPGTAIEVTDLFFNTPARKKFLKSEDTEAAHIEHQVRLHALAFPNVRFIFRKNGQLCFDLPATDDFRVRIGSLTDPASAAGLIAVTPQYGPGITVTGFLLPLSETRRTRKGQFIFLNKRPIEDKLVTRAIRDGYGGLPTGLHPSLYLYIDVEPALVDVNVHPAKREVRFKRPSDVITAIIQAITSTLTAQSSATTAVTTPRAENEGTDTVPPPCTALNPPAAPPLPEMAPVTKADQPAISSPSPPSATRESLIRPLPVKSVSSLPPTQTRLAIDSQPRTPVEKPFPFRYIGSLRGRFGLFENEDGLVVFFPRSARERIIFEKLMESKDKGLPGQALLDPILLELDPRDFDVLNGLRGHFDKAGISLVPFGQRTMRVETIPPMLELSDAKTFILDLIDRITHSEYSKKASRLAFETFAGELASRSAKLEKLDLTHATPLLKELLRCEVPYCTPSGKPTLVMYSMQEIAKKFGLS